MRVPDQITKCVVFVGCQKCDGTYVFAGSALFFGDDTANPRYACFITARHVIDGIAKLLVEKVWLRVNAKSGGCEWVSTDLSKWIRHPSLDVAVFFGYLNTEADHMILHRQWALTPPIAQNLNIGVGDAIFITGLFANYPGTLRNVPLVRIGNLAAYPEQRIRATGFMEMDAYLVEARSLGGLSGSPVFYHAQASNFGILRPFAPQWLSPPIPEPKSWTADDVNSRKTLPFYLMGIVHGHYNQEKNAPDANRRDIEELNTGIAIVVPIAKVLEFLDAESSRRASSIG
jgi:hypothetical protein